MKVLLLGADGQVGWELRRSLDPIGELVACTRSDADLECPDQIANLLDKANPNIVVNAAAYTAVDNAEQEPGRARKINTDAVDLLAKHAASSGSLLVHYSTDYVFDGMNPNPYTESDNPNPLNVYGQTKLDGERAIQESGCRHLIFRTSWVYSLRGSNFFRTILRLSQEREELKIVSDQVGSPSSAQMIADATALALSTECTGESERRPYSGLYHMSAGGQASWYELAEYFLQRCPHTGGRVRINPVSTDQYPTTATRPLNSLLNSTRFAESFGRSLPDWRFHLDRFIATMNPQEAQ